MNSMTTGAKKKRIIDKARRQNFILNQNTDMAPPPRATPGGLVDPADRVTGVRRTLLPEKAVDH